MNRSVFLPFIYPIPAKNLLLIFLISSLIISCGKIPDGIVESHNADYSVAAITAPASVTYHPTDSTVTASVRITNAQYVSRVWCKVSSLDGSITISSQTLLYDDGNQTGNGDQTRGDGIYSGRFVMGKLKPNGKYQIEFYVENNIQQSPENLAKVGTHIFNFDNLQINYLPVLSDLILPASVNRSESFIFSVKVSDANGYADISQVYFKLFRPDGSQVLNGATDYFLMADNGDLNLGDQKAGDGTFSFKNSFGSTAPTGNWRFEFYAKDFTGGIGNVLKQNVTVN